jgi:hypothetical protein
MPGPYAPAPYDQPTRPLKRWVGHRWRAFMTAVGAVAAVLGLAPAVIGGAWAMALPPILDRVPSGSGAVVVIPSVERLERAVRQWAGSVNLPAENLDVLRLLDLAGLAAGFDPRGSIAVVIAPPAQARAAEDEGDAPQPSVVALVSVTDYDRFIIAAEGRPDEEVATIRVGPEGQRRPAYARRLGPTLAAVGPERAAVRAFSGEPGHMARHAELLGPRGTAYAQGCDLFVFVDVGPLAEPLKQGLAMGLRFFTELNEAGDERPAPDLSSLVWLVEMMLDQTRAVVAGVRFVPQGINADLLMTFREGSALARTAAAPGRSSALLGRVPDRPYLLAAALDLASLDWKPLFAGMPEPKAHDVVSKISMAEQRLLGEHCTGRAVLMLPHEAGIGFMNKTITYSATQDPRRYIRAWREWLDHATDEGLIQSDVMPDELKIGARSADAWSMSVKARDPEEAQLMLVLYGAMGGPSGYLVGLEDGVVQTTMRDQGVLAAALASASTGQGLNLNPRLADVADALPAGRFAEVYLSPNGLVDTLRGLAAMVGALPRVPMAKDLPPFGAGLSTGEGSLMASLFLPSASIGELIRFGQGVRDRMIEGPRRQGRPGEPEPARPQF